MLVKSFFNPFFFFLNLIYIIDKCVFKVNVMSFSQQNGLVFMWLSLSAAVSPSVPICASLSQPLSLSLSLGRHLFILWVSPTFWNWWCRLNSTRRDATHIIRFNILYNDDKLRNICSKQPQTLRYQMRRRERREEAVGEGEGEE